MKKKAKKKPKFNQKVRQEDIKIPEGTANFDDLMTNILKVKPRLK